MPKRPPLLERLEEERKELQRKIAEARKAEAKKQAETDRRRREIIAAALAAEIAEHPEMEEQFRDVLERRVKAASARRMLGLDPLPKPSQPDGPQEVT